jgi:hypothetical protein
VRCCSPVPPLEVLPAPPLGALAAGVAAGGDPDDRDGDDISSSHSTDLLEEQEPDRWVARPITRDVACGCHFHDALDTLLCRALDRHTWSIEYHCVVYQHSGGATPDHWEATFLVCRLEDGLRVRRSTQSIILSLSETQLRRPCKMSHGVRFRTTAWCLVGWPMVLT